MASGSLPVWLLFLVQSFALAILAAEAAKAQPLRNPNSYLVGGEVQWTFGFDYSSWAQGLSPFFANDTLEFDYVPAHNVLLFKDASHYSTCNFTEATLLADESKGAPGFVFTLANSNTTYLFGCSKGRNFSHCNAGLMKFSVHTQ